jgi:hypothetical protein
MIKKLKIPTQDFELNTDYSFSINSQEQHWKQNSIHRPIKMIQHYLKILSHIKDYCEFELTPEMSPKTGRWHYHGVIRFTSYDKLYNFYLIGLNKLTNLSVYEIDTINNIKHWQQYCTKNKSIFEPFIKPYRLTHLTTYKEPSPNVFQQYGIK